LRLRRAAKPFPTNPVIPAKAGIHDFLLKNTHFAVNKTTARQTAPSKSKVFCFFFAKKKYFSS
jgi:hypothetical protein